MQEEKWRFTRSAAAPQAGEKHPEGLNAGEMEQGKIKNDTYRADQKQRDGLGEKPGLGGEGIPGEPLEPPEQHAHGERNGTGST